MNKETKLQKAKCKTCSKIICVPGWSTTCLHRHMNTHRSKKNGYININKLF